MDFELFILICSCKANRPKANMGCACSRHVNAKDALTAAMMCVFPNRTVLGVSPLVPQANTEIFILKLVRTALCHTCGHYGSKSIMSAVGTVLLNKFKNLRVECICSR